MTSPARNLPPHTVIMGVAGSGKTTVGEALQAATGAPYLDGDAYHPQANIEKMSKGIPLTDDDRWPWLDRFAEEMLRTDPPVVGGCSSLKRSYRDRIRATLGDDTMFVFLNGTRELLEERMAARTRHFMPVSLLESQLATLEPPAADERHIEIDIDNTMEAIVAMILQKAGAAG